MASVGPVSSAPVFLYGEDDPPTAALVAQTLQALDASAQLFVVGASRAAFRFLRRQPPYEAAPRPDLLILDLLLPGEDGFSLLAAVRQDADLCSLPAVFFSTSLYLSDEPRARALGALGFVNKPLPLPDFEEAVRGLVSLVPHKD